MRIKYFDFNTIGIEKISIAFLCIFSLAFADYRYLSIGSTLLAFGIVFLSNIRGKGINKDAIVIIFSKILFVLWAALSTFWSVNSEDTGYYSITLILRALTFFSVILFINSDENKLFFSKMVIIAALVLIVRILISVPFSAYGTSRIGNYLSHDAESTYGNTSLTYVFGCASAILIFDDYKIIKNKILKYGIFALFTFFSIMSGSKKVVFILLIFLLVFIFKKTKDVFSLIKYLSISFFVVMIIYILIMNVNVLYNSIGNRLEAFINFFVDDGGETDLSTSTRSQFISASWDTFKEYPLMGVGLDGFKDVNPYQYTWAENNFLEILADLGIVGLLIYIFPYIYVLVKTLHSYKNKKYLDYANVALFLTLLFIDFTMVSYRSLILQFFMAAFIGNCIVNKKRVKEYIYAYNYSFIQ